MDDADGFGERLHRAMTAWQGVGITMAEWEAAQPIIAAALEESDRWLAAHGLSLDTMLALRRAGQMDELRARITAAGLRLTPEG